MVDLISSMSLSLSLQHLVSEPKTPMPPPPIPEIARIALKPLVLALTELPESLNEVLVFEPKLLSKLDELLLSWQLMAFRAKRK